MQRGNDSFTFNRRALLQTTDPWRLKGETQIVGFTAYGTEPAGTNRRVIFQIDNNFWYFTQDGLKEFPYHTDIDNILKHGNTVAELLAVNGIAKWINKDVYPIIALEAPRDAAVMPKLQLGLKVNCFNDEYSRSVFSNVYELPNTARILAVNANKNLRGFAKANVKIRLRDNVGDWSDWLDLDDAVDKIACAIQFKTDYILTTLDGTDEANVFCSLEYVTDSYNSSCDILEIFTVPLIGSENIGVVRAFVKHSELFDAEVSAFVNLSSPVKRRDNIIIGRGTGKVEEYFLGIGGGIDPNINQNSIRITADGTNVAEFFYDTSRATVQFKADFNAEICANYEYSLPAENWLPMTCEGTTPCADSSLYITRFYFRNANSQNATVKFSFKRKNGVISKNLGTANGTTQTFVLPHRALSDSIILNGNWQYDEDSRILKVTNTIGEDLTLSYDWTGELPKVESFVIGAEYVV